MLKKRCLSSVVLILLFVPLVFATIPFTSEAPLVDDFDDGFCEVHGLFNYVPPSEANDATVEETLKLVLSDGSEVEKNILEVVDGFLDRLSEGDTIYLYVFTSVEGPDSHNDRISIVRMKFLENFIKLRPVFEEKSLKIVKQSLGETDMFWPISTGEKNAVNDKAEIVEEVAKAPPLVANRRFVLSKFPINNEFKIGRPYKYYDSGCEVKNMGPLILPVTSSEDFVIMSGEGIRLEISVDDPDLKEPASDDVLKFYLSGAPPGMVLEKLDEDTVIVDFDPSEIMLKGEKELHFTLTVEDSAGAHSSKTYSYALIPPVVRTEIQKPNFSFEIFQSFPWYYYISLLGLLFFIPGKYRRFGLRRSILSWRKDLENFEDWKLTISFLKSFETKLKRAEESLSSVNDSIRGLDEISKMTILDKFRDVSYLYDAHQSSLKSLDRGGRSVRVILEKYIDFLQHLFELKAYSLAFDTLLHRIHGGHLKLRNSSQEHELIHLVSRARISLRKIFAQSEDALTDVEEFTEKGNILLTRLLRCLQGNLRHIFSEGFIHWFKTPISIKNQHFWDNSYASGKVGSFEEFRSNFKMHKRKSDYRFGRPDWWVRPHSGWNWTENRGDSVKLLRSLAEGIAKEYLKEGCVRKELGSVLSVQQSIVRDMIGAVESWPDTFSISIVHPAPEDYITHKFVKKGVVSASISGGIPDFYFEVLWGDPEGMNVSLTSGSHPADKHYEIHFSLRSLAKTLKKIDLLDPKYLFNGSYILSVIATDSAGNTASDKVFIKFDLLGKGVVSSKSRIASKKIELTEELPADLGLKVMGERGYAKIKICVDSLKNREADECLATALEELKGDLILGNDPLIKGDYRVRIAKDGKADVYKAFAFDILVFGDRMRNDKFDTFGRKYPAGIGIPAFIDKIFTKAGYGVLIDDISVCSSDSKRAISLKMDLASRDISRLNAVLNSIDNSMLRRIVEKIIVELENLRSGLKHSLYELGRISARSEDLKHRSSPVFGAFAAEITSVAQSKIDWNKDVHDVSEMITSFGIVKKELDSMIVNFRSEGKRASKLMDDSFSKIKFLVEEWRELVKSVK